MKISKKLIGTLFIAQNVLSPIAFADQVSVVNTVQKNFEKLEQNKKII